jgi:polyhydroxyalkanoate synthesis regulator phasin
VEGAEQLRRMLHEIPAGRKVTLVISRDGAQQTLAVELADRKAIEQKAWNNIGQGGDVFAPPSGMGILPGNGGGDVPAPGFHLPVFGSSLNVGAMVEPLSSQMAEYLGVQGGVMVKQVARKSAAQTAGLKAFDVIVKVGAEAIDTSADWDRALRSNEGKTVQVTVLRDKKQQTLNLQVASRKRGALEFEWPFAPGACAPGFDGSFLSDVDAMVAELLPAPDRELDPQTSNGVEAEAEAEARKAGDEARKAAGEIQKLFESGNFPFNRQQLDEFRQQMDQLRQSFRADDFKIDPKQMEELRKQMDDLRKSLPSQEQMDQLRRQMDQFRRQMQNLAPVAPGHSG